ncbi:MAG TPA: TIGR00153 family protein [Longimicrobiales bacterium]|nr:TIGR00153 family protein [Longimicrobiales bacterium]
MRNVFGLFGRSPFKPLADHAGRVQTTVELVPDLFEAFMSGNWQETEALYERISKLEHKADVVKNEIRDHLPKSMFMPVDRGDVLRFLKEQDAIADAAEDLAVMLTIRRTDTPEAIREDVMELVRFVVQISATWYELAQELPTLQEASFTGPEVEKTMENIGRISDMEWKADQMQWAVSRQLFDHEEELGVVSVMIWMHVLGLIGRIANHAENTADLLRLMLARR